ncbi:hypothetical protein F2P79_023254 [Pimephales promelas]|nr:hypothetical protein F2P79_023254 [Pimephales promelas]
MYREVKKVKSRPVLFPVVTMRSLFLSHRVPLLKRLIPGGVRSGESVTRTGTRARHCSVTGSCILLSRVPVDPLRLPVTVLLSLPTRLETVVVVTPG